MPGLQPAAQRGGGGAGVRPATAADFAALADPAPAGMALDQPAYPGVRVGDFRSGRGLFGVNDSVGDRLRHEARARIDQLLTHSVGGSQPNPATVASGPIPKLGAGGQILHGFGHGYVDEFKSLYEGLFNTGQAQDPDLIGTALAQATVGALRANPFELGRTLYNNTLSDSLDTIAGFDAAKQNGTLPYFFGDRLGHGAATATQAAVTDGLVKFAGPALRSGAQGLAKGAVRAADTAKLHAQVVGDLIARGADGQYYTVAHEVHLDPKSYPGVDRSLHNREANEALLNQIQLYPDFAGMMQNLGINVGRTPTGLAPTKSPPSWTWHHDLEPGALQLVPRVEHMWGSLFQKVLHPGGKGGFHLWGK